MRHLGYLLITVIVLALACNLPRPTEEMPTAAPPTAPSAHETVLPATVAAETAPPATLPAEATLAPTPTVAPPTPSATLVPIPPGYAVEQEATVGTYRIRVWRNTAADSLPFDAIAEIEGDGSALARVALVTNVDVSGRDVTGDGHPDLVIETYSGGAHCCWSTIIYDLGPTLTEVLRSRPSNCGGVLRDLDGDGVLEFETCDDVFAYVYCPYAMSPSVRAVLRYQPGQGYGPASPQFAALYVQDIAEHTALAQAAQPEEMGEWDGTTKCSVLPLVLDYLYSGQPGLAWDTLVQYYAYPDRALLWAEVLRAAAWSSLYVPTAPPPAPWPEHYMLQLLTSCGPNEQFIGFLSAGQDPCAPEVPRRDLFWLQQELQWLGLIQHDESLEIAPAGCTSDCRIDVTDSAATVRLGSIRLETVSGFPGAVFRTNGQESAHWRLRGDLSWEQIAP